MSTAIENYKMYKALSKIIKLNSDFNVLFNGTKKCDQFKIVAKDTKSKIYDTLDMGGLRDFAMYCGFKNTVPKQEG